MQQREQKFCKIPFQSYICNVFLTSFSFRNTNKMTTLVNEFTTLTMRVVHNNYKKEESITTQLL